MRITGMSSGLDIDTIVKQLMKGHQMPIDRLSQKKQVMEWQRDDYRQLNSKIVDFRNNKLFNYSLSSSLSATKTTLSGDTNAFTAKSLTNAVEGSLTVKVNDLAKAASVTSTAGIAPNASTQVTLATLIADGKLADFSDSTITINGSAIAVDKNTDTISSLISKINKDTGAKANAFFDQTTGKLSITSKETGNINGTGNIALAGDLLTGAFNMNTFSAGADAQVEINGVATTRSSNTFTVNGVEITLKAKTVGDPTVITVSKDTDKFVDTIKSFIKDYNELIDTMNNKIKEERYKDYLPLTADQKSEMKENEIKLWEEKAKSGLLRNESLVQKGITDLRTDVTKPVKIGADDVTLGELGLVTGKYYEGGKLTLKDEAKLRQMIETDPDKVMSFFTGKGATHDETGLFERMKDNLQETLNAFASKVGTSAYSSSTTQPYNTESMMGREIKKLLTQISEKSSKLTTLENNYYKKFNAMEQAMNKYQAQSASLMNSFGGQ
ncbi:flagellar filament capping protein FliD [Paenibacillus gansuensis]|uniref:Flagellar hook-associated protein 2 n=1 Tax=Paenibacillus gansuensis TaxID=306542 RepID=A0ABW5PKJ4_9BACL